MNLLSSSVYKNMTEVKQSMPELSLRCRDIGMDCPFEVIETSRPGLMRKYAEHAESLHNLPFLSADQLLKIHRAIKK
jgi:predicted small metal-binding protein